MIKTGPILRLAALYALSIILMLPQAMLSSVVINEVHHDDTPKTHRGEFVELFNAGEESIDLSGWKLEGIGDYTFPDNTQIEPHQFLVIAENQQTMRFKFKVNTSHSYTGGIDNDGDDLKLIDSNGALIDRVNYKSGFPWPSAARGTGASMELLHPSLDNNLGGSWRSSEQPTPGAENSIFTTSIPPQIRQVTHAPIQPQETDDVLITAKVTDPDGVQTVTLSYQRVEPGSYIHKNDRTYERNWIELAMNDTGEGGDILADDDTYTVTIPASNHAHRLLVRYRITVRDNQGNEVTTPYSDDESPNFAYFVYNGVPSWSGAKRPRVSPDHRFPGRHDEPFATCLPFDRGQYGC
jgi:hypothetical protein